MKLQRGNELACRPNHSIHPADEANAAIVATTIAFWSRSRVAGALMMPYLAWVTFAVLLNVTIYRMNS